MLRREIWVDRTGKVVRYNLAYINHSLYGGDDGRVLGYDSAHGRPHRHFKGRLTALSGGSFAHVDALFQREWAKIMKEVTHAKD